MPPETAHLARKLLAIVGPGEGAPPDAVADAERIGELAARAGWVVLCGGRNAGVMAAAARGAALAGGIAIGLLPSPDHRETAPGLTAALATGLGEARDAALAQSCDAMVVCGMSAGTAAEVALAIRAWKPVVLIRPERATEDFLAGLSGDRLFVTGDADQAVALLMTSS
jgi:uncharacterized protein (TIGR00725 family)